LSLALSDVRQFNQKKEVNTMRRLFPLILSVLMTLSVLFLPVLAARQPAADADTASILRIATSEDVDSLSPLVAYERAASELFLLTYDSLVSFDEDLEPRPDLAASWEVSEDNLTWTFHLQEGVLWHDGEPFTSADVKYTYELLMETELGMYPPFLEGISSIETPDDLTVVIGTDEPKANMLQNPTPILPMHIWGEMDLAALESFDNDAVIGTGPFKFKEWKRGQYLSLAANPDYFLTPPNIGGVVFTIFTNRDTMAQAIINNEVDVTMGLYPSQLGNLTADPNIDVYEFADNGFTQLAINCWADSASKGNPLLRDAIIRQAIDYAVDKQGIIDIAFEGSGTLATTLVSPATPFWHYEPAPEELRSFDLAKAAALLDAAGYRDTNGDGVREDAAGNPLKFRFMVRSDNTREVKAGQMIKGSLLEVGIETSLNTVDDGVLNDAIIASDYDLFIWGWGGDVDPTTILGLLTTGQIDGNNEPRYSNAEFDAAYALQMTILDEAERQAVVFQAQQIAYAEAPFVIISYDESIQAVRKDNLTNVTPVGGDEGPIIYANTNYNYLQAKMDGTGGGGGGMSSTVVVIILGALVAAAGYFFFVRRKKSGGKANWE
jgi:peptide/nickel transport system substrate-binding protein